MKRKVIRTDGTVETLEVGDGFRSWNKVIGASIGEIVHVPDSKMELWCDEEALCKNEPEANLLASVIAGRYIFGDVIAFHVGDIK